MNRFERLVGLLAARRPEPTMTVARSVADVLDDHVVFEVESIDRMYLNVWQPRLPLRLDGVDGPDDQDVRRRHPRLRRRPRPGTGRLRQGSAQGRSRAG